MTIRRLVRFGTVACSAMTELRTIRLGVLGGGTVGSSFCQLIAEQSEEIARRTGLMLEIAAVTVRDLTKPRPGVDPTLLTDDTAGVVADPTIDVIIETMGGVDHTMELVLSAFAAGKPVVTANKELLALRGPELHEAANAAGVDLALEASVAAGLPFIRALRESLVGENITRVMGIVNGTTNYILSQMTDHGAGYVDALGEAQRLGFAEADPTADVDGFDAGSKAAIIATLSFGQAVRTGDVYVEGISKITAEDITNADHLGYLIKLLAVVQRNEDGSIGARVHPTMIPKTHPLASVRDSFNAVYVEGTGIDQVMFYGRGAGGHPTAAMMVGDAIDVAKNLTTGCSRGVGPLPDATVRSIDDITSAFYISVDARDEPGVLASIAGSFGNRGVSIRSMEQEGLGDEARLVFITHGAVESDVRATLADLAELDSVKNIGQVLRVIGD
jgi:homoserine dehydrogenase